MFHLRFERTRVIGRAYGPLRNGYIYSWPDRLARTAANTPILKQEHLLAWVAGSLGTNLLSLLCTNRSESYELLAHESGEASMEARFSICSV